MNSNEIFDRDSVLGMVGGDPELLDDLVTMFKSHYPTVIEELRDAINQSDATGIRESAHQLKGVVGNFYAPSCTESASTLEQYGKDGELTNVPARFAQLQTELDALEHELDSLCSELI